ncbi:MAG: hypothetical protein EBY16_01715 [Gammaproteobacteria bacterium]|nr:hypothetical protein [Gammaproteobacteria bacterium]
MLTELESFDFRQMRANDGRATDEALEQFHQIFHAFFAQFPDKRIIPFDVLQTYVAQMRKITAKINQAEYQYFLAKYQAEYSTETPQMRESMAKGNELDSYKKIRSRLQFWAASPTWGNAVRFPEEHLNTVKNLEAWEKLIEPEQSQQTRPSKKIKFN